ncbi:MAG TPA: hypothetical protein VN688_30730 [Gemmataceae bacterium]|nr:hypothetical protein [Gemmataceae bacterium]
MVKLPIAINLTVCEQVIVEEKTHNITLVNCLTRLRVREIPSEPHRLVVHARLTDGHGESRLRLQLTRLDTLDEISIQEATVKFSHPLQEFRADFRVVTAFPVEGRYQVTLLADGEMIAQRTLQVFTRKEES